MPTTTTTPTAAALARVLADRTAAAALSQVEVDYLVTRLADRGVFPHVHNWGGVACLVPHEHGDGVTCSRTGPVFDRRYVRVYESDEDGIADLLRVAHHATLSGPVANLEESEPEVVLVGGKAAAVGGLAGHLNGIEAGCRRASDALFGIAGYRSVEALAPDGQDVAGSEADKLDGAPPVRPVELSGITADLFGPSAEAQKRIEEVAAQWATLYKKMQADPVLFKLLATSFDRWLGFWDRYQRRNDLRADQLIVLSSDVRPIIADVNASRANAEERDRGKVVEVQDLPPCGPGDAEKGVACKTADIASEDVSKARGKAQAAEDVAKSCFSSPEALQKCVEDWASRNKWKILAGSLLSVVAAATAARVAAKAVPI